MASLFQNPRAFAIKADGTTYPGMLAYFYKAGTTQDQGVYQDSNLTTLHAQPVVANDQGSLPPIYMDSEAENDYRVIFRTSAGSLIPGGDTDNIPRVSVYVPTFNQTADELTASVTPTVYAYQADPVADARRYGFATGATAAVNAAAIATAISALKKTSSIPGGTVQLPSGEYDCDAFTVPQFVNVKGAGQRSTKLNYSGSGSLATLGGNINALSYGCGLTDSTIILSDLAGRAVKLLCTNGAQVARLYIEGPLTAGRSNIGLAVDGGNASNFFNKIDSVICNHVENSFRVMTSGSQRATNTTFINCSALGDVATIGTASKGLTIDASNGDGVAWIGGNFEACGTAVYYANGALSTSISGARFEGNTKDFNAVNGAFAQSIHGIQTETEYNVTDPGNVLRFYGATLLGGTFWKRDGHIRIFTGTGAFSASSSVTVTIGQTMPHTNYVVQAIDNSGAYTTSFAYRHNSGSNSTTTFSLSAPASTSNTFTWVLYLPNV